MPPRRIHDSGRALVAFLIFAVTAGLALWFVLVTTAGWGTFRGICATTVGATLLLMVLMARAGRASSRALDETGAESDPRG